MQPLKQLAKKLKKETYAIYLASKDTRMPWYAKLLAAIVVAYAVSPIDLIPDFVPILGYLDDLILVPLGIWLVLKMIPPSVLAECRQRAEATQPQEKPTSLVAAGVIVIIWVILGSLIVLLLKHFLKR
ncbi:hypothetical protein SAMD00079811_49470 [Scytonema sp. HK-05]|uniref:YkvA family protein n=1 Tax=Scytonema sp. HK-05 TaxID=1137095 RepID=UPI000937D886|nr:YkvA family protein [Scytonema sp. HK-05]OKH52652.1 hypothetical protein NIES2130_31765 [Scytonema sp. HK-05]BAY47329.1 hypothetical protein SAMD00079811_49470 [Scytonema sp. HK-05]